MCLKNWKLLHCVWRYFHDIEGKEWLILWTEVLQSWSSILYAWQSNIPSSIPKKCSLSRYWRQASTSKHQKPNYPSSSYHEWLGFTRRESIKAFPTLFIDILFALCVKRFRGDECAPKAVKAIIKFFHKKQEFARYVSIFEHCPQSAEWAASALLNNGQPVRI